MSAGSDDPDGLAQPGGPPAIDLDDVRRAAARLDGVARRTPVLTSRALDERLNAKLMLKAEVFQRGGAFKFRGAYNAVSSLDIEARARGVCAVSSGNHAQAVTLAAGLCGTRAVILMPSDAPAVKRAATEYYGAEVVEYDRYRDDREALARRLAAERDLTLVHPFDNPWVMAGQGTAALELVSDTSLDALVVPVGGGGLISGCATVCAALEPSARVIGVEPAASDDTARSLASGHRVRVEVGRTIADGQQAPTPGELTWPIIHRLVDEVVVVTDEQIVGAMRFCFERLKLVVEPSGACALAALLAGVIPVAGQRVGVILSGGNVDATAFARLMLG
ncbi:MAG TPA: pyridoxal-phosphate dependent enzyme [Solirubrobacteraceae bacterium]|nr:pyridoxal-phosphate dependent enzyme [Solirubrobacteraceae bacterium]